DRQHRRTVVMSGPIVPDDVKAFKAWLVCEPYTHVVKLTSPGGSIEAAMEIGRLIRARFMETSTYTLAPEQERRCSVKDAIEYFRNVRQEEARIVFFTGDQTDRDIDILHQVKSKHPYPQATNTPPSVYDWLRPKCGEVKVISCLRDEIA